MNKHGPRHYFFVIRMRIIEAFKSPLGLHDWLAQNDGDDYWLNEARRFVGMPTSSSNDEPTNIDEVMMGALIYGRRDFYEFMANKFDDFFLRANIDLIVDMIKYNDLDECQLLMTQIMWTQNETQLPIDDIVAAYHVSTRVPYAPEPSNPSPWLFAQDIDCIQKYYDAATTKRIFIYGTESTLLPSLRIILNEASIDWNIVSIILPIHASNEYVDKIIKTLPPINIA